MVSRAALMVFMGISVSTSVPDVSITSANNTTAHA